MSEKRFIISILVSDPFNPNLSINTENYILGVLNEQYVGKCYNGALILKINTIDEISSCEIITTNLLGNGNINVKFTAMIRRFYPGEFLPNVWVQKTQPSILGSYAEDNDGISVMAYIMIPYGIQFEPSPLKQSIMTIREHQRIPMRVIDVYHKCANPIPAIGATLLVCEKKYNKYIITSSVGKGIKKMLSPLMKRIEEELQLRNDITPDIKENILFFESLLYSYRSKENKENKITSTNFPEWAGPNEIPMSVDGEVINLLDYLHNIDDNIANDNIIGIWSRPLNIYKSSPNAVFRKLSPGEELDMEADPLLIEEGSPESVFIRFLKDILDYLSIVRKMAEYYIDNATLMSHKNIWDAMKEVQLIH
jgi:hypothetical protein